MSFKKRGRKRGRKTVRCQICGKNRGSRVIKDKTYSPLPTNEVIICEPCFKDWCVNDKQALLQKIRNKLLRGHTSD